MQLQTTLLLLCIIFTMVAKQTSSSLAKAAAPSCTTHDSANKGKLMVPGNLPKPKETKESCDLQTLEEINAEIECLQKLTEEAEESDDEDAMDTDEKENSAPCTTKEQSGNKKCCKEDSSKSTLSSPTLDATPAKPIALSKSSKNNKYKSQVSMGKMETQIFDKEDESIKHTCIIHTALVIEMEKTKANKCVETIAKKIKGVFKMIQTIDKDITIHECDAIPKHKLVAGKMLFGRQHCNVPTIAH